VDDLLRLLDEGETLPGSMSGSLVRGVRYRGVPAVAKTVSARELRFHLETAARLPVRTARLLDHQRTVGGAFLVFEEIVPTGEPSWDAVVADLALLHGCDVAAPASPEPVPAPRDVLEGFWADDHDLLTRVLADGPCTDDVLLPTHGDAHLGTVLADATGLVWLDWAEFGLGSPAADLGFCSARAAATERGPLPGALDDGVRRYERWVLMAQWPEFARWNPPEAAERVRRRVHELTRG